jgi:hypothetical protein
MLATLVASQNWGEKNEKSSMNYGHPGAAFKKFL